MLIARPRKTLGLVLCGGCMDEALKVGDVVTCSRSGWWRVQSLDPHRNNRIILELVLSKDGRIPKKTARTYSAFKNWCKKITVEEVKKSKEFQNKILDTLLLIIDPKQNIEDEEIIKSLECSEKPEPEYLIRIGPPPSLLKR